MTTSDILLKETTSRCPNCYKSVPARVFKRGISPETVLLESDCSEHGLIERIISSDARFYHLAKGSPLNGCCGGSCSSASSDGRDGTVGTNAYPGEKAGHIEVLSTCVALIEIVDSCNLACPTCFAESPRSREIDARPYEELIARIQGVIDRKGKIEILQFSGGEPTLHPEFFRLLEWARLNPGIDYVLINTNGVRIATDDDFARQLGEAFRTHKKIQLYLQFDGPQAEGQQMLRGADLRQLRERVIERCGEFDLPITLAMTVVPENVGHLWDTIAFGLKHEHVRGVAFQPAFLSGRTSLDEGAQRLNTADIILGIVDQAGELLHYGDFTPLPCGDPNCATIGWVFRIGGEYFSPTAHGVNLPALQALVPDRINYSLADLEACGCETTELGHLIQQLELKEANAFRLFIKPFMDAGTWDEDRIDRCCTHVIRPDGKLDSFCRYYSGFAEPKKKIVLGEV